MTSLEILRKLSVLRAPEGKPFILKSGKTSQVYVDVRLTALDPHGLRQLCHDLHWMISGMRTGASLVAGVALGGCPLATGVSLMSLQESEFRDSVSGRPMYDCLPVLGALYVRTEAKDHGTGKLVEGRFEPGESVVLVEDVVTSGISSARAIGALQEAGLRVQAVVSVLDREEGGRANLEALGVPFKALVTLTELLRDGN